MGHREDLLAGAKRCLYEKGYAHITARDIVEASNTNLASIGYHFGSKEALLNSAMMEALRDLGEQLDLSVQNESAQDLGNQLSDTWTHITQDFAEHMPLWRASIEAYIQAQHSPALRSELVLSLQQIRLALAQEAQQTDPEMDDRTAWATGTVQLALLTGLTLQWMVSPEHTLTGEELSVALRALSGSAAEAKEDAEEATEG